MTLESGQTPLEVYDAALATADQKRDSLREQLAAERRKIKDLEGALTADIVERQALTAVFLQNVSGSDELYRAMFELEATGSLEFPKDLARARAADHIARQLLVVQGVLESADDSTFLLSVRKKPLNLVSNLTGASYPHDSDLERQTVCGVQAVLLQIPVGARITPATSSQYIPFQGEVKRATDIMVPISSSNTVDSVTGGFDHDVWAEKPVVSSDTFTAPDFYSQSLRRVITKDYSVKRNSDEMNFIEYDGVFVGREAIQHAFGSMVELKLEPRTLDALGTVLATYDLAD